MNEGYQINEDIFEKYTGTETSVVIPDGIKTIGKEAFAGNNTIEEITLPVSLKKIEANAFLGCGALKKVVYMGYSFEWIKNVRLKNEYSSPFYYGAEMYERGERRVCDLNGIGDGDIPDFAFLGCSSIEEINVDRIYGSRGIVGKRAFENCSNLAYLCLPKDRIGKEAFKNCVSLNTAVLKFTEAIEKGAFCGCRSLSRIVLHRALRLIEENAFKDCKILQVFFNEDYTYFNRMVRCDGAHSDPRESGAKIRPMEEFEKLLEGLNDENAKGDMEYERELGIAGLSADGERRIVSCLNTEKSVTVPEGTLIIGKGAFGAHPVEQVELSSTLVKIEDYAFNSCDKLKTLEIPEGVCEIGKGAFAESGIEKIKLPGGISTMGKEMFYDCEDLEYIELGEGILEIPNAMLHGCTSLREVKLPTTLKKICADAFEGCSSLEKIELPRGLEEIDWGAFSEAAVEYIYVPGTVKTVGDFAFSDSHIKEADVCEGVERICECSFDTEYLKRITLPSTIKFIGASAIDFDAVDKVEYAGTRSDFENIEFEKPADKKPLMEKLVFEKSVRMNKSSKGDIVIPEGVEIIEKEMFKKNTDITSVVFPSTLRAIEEDAFKDCSSLKKITFNSPIKKIGRCAFSCCSALEAVEIMGDECVIDSFAFERCKSMKALKLEGVKEIGGGAFGHCWGLKEVILPMGLKRIYAQAFADCVRLIRVYIPASVEKVYDYAFSDCKIVNIEIAGRKSIPSAWASDWNLIEEIKVLFFKTKKKIKNIKFVN